MIFKYQIECSRGKKESSTTIGFFCAIQVLVSSFTVFFAFFNQTEFFSKLRSHITTFQPERFCQSFDENVSSESHFRCVWSLHYDNQDRLVQ